MSDYPEVIYLIPGYDEHIFSLDPDPSGEGEGGAVEYVRADKSPNWERIASRAMRHMADIAEALNAPMNATGPDLVTWVREQALSAPQAASGVPEEIRAFLENLATPGSEPLNSAVGYGRRDDRRAFMGQLRAEAARLLEQSGGTSDER